MRRKQPAVGPAALYVGGVRAAALSHSSNTTRRTGRLVTPSMPVSSSALDASPPQPSWRGATLPKGRETVATRSHR